jgi:hypothetical protein
MVNSIDVNQFAKKIIADRSGTQPKNRKNAVRLYNAHDYQPSADGAPRSSSETLNEPFVPACQLNAKFLRF